MCVLHTYICVFQIENIRVHVQIMITKFYSSIFFFFHLYSVHVRVYCLVKLRNAYTCTVYMCIWIIISLHTHTRLMMICCLGDVCKVNVHVFTRLPASVVRDPLVHGNEHTLCVLFQRLKSF